MNLYQVRVRHLRFDNPKQASKRFPGDAVIRIAFRANPAFGGGGVGNIVRQGTQAQITWNANVGRQTAASDEPMKPLDVIVETAEFDAHFRGTVLTLRGPVPSAQHLHNVIATFYYHLPLVLNVAFTEPPVIKMVDGEVGSQHFSWELAHFSHGVEVTNETRQGDRLLTAWNRLNLVGADDQRRIARALHYFHVAVRLERVGNSSWEFMSEILLNLCKILEVLFPPDGDRKTRDAVRRGLSSLGYAHEEIERGFIPVMALRDALDVGHVSLVSLPRQSLQIIHGFTERAEPTFREMLERLLTAVQAGGIEIEAYVDGGTNATVDQVVRRLAADVAE
jgi:hypothetical protein